MSFYNMLFGMNHQTDFLLAVLGLRKNDVERLRNVFSSEDGKTIEIYTRTGGGNRDDYPNLLMRKLPTWTGSVDDDYDSTYCTDTFEVPAEWVDDVKALSDVLANGIRKEFGQHLLATLRREPTEDDKATAAYEKESADLRRLPHFMANGHTFVPQNDYAMEQALKMAEANGGKLRSCWGIAPITITVRQNFHPWPNATRESDRKSFVRIETSYDGRWSMDMAYWKHCEDRFAATYPQAMANVRKTVNEYSQRSAA